MLLLMQMYIFTNLYERIQQTRTGFCYAFSLITPIVQMKPKVFSHNKNTNQSEYVLAQSQLYKSLGDEEKASTYLQKAKRQGYEHPGYVLLQE